jgi:hypothetical protein
VTACQVPSSDEANQRDAFAGRLSIPEAGRWHTAWSPRLQAEWLQAFYRMAISKPFVESVCWRDLADLPGHFIPNGGLCTMNLKPKLAYKELRNFRAVLAAAAAAAETQPKPEP